MRLAPPLLVALCSLVAALLALTLPGVPSAEAEYRGCYFQKPQDFLIRKNFMLGKAIDGKKSNRAIKYRVEHYGRIEGAPYEELNSQTAHSQATSVKFMGLPISVHKKIAPALACVEKRLKKTCTKGDERYRPRAMGGFR